jgi:hypothetical protein
LRNIGAQAVQFDVLDDCVNLFPGGIAFHDYHCFSPVFSFPNAGKKKSPLLERALFTSTLLMG